MKVLNKIIRITAEGVEYEADQRHVELVVKQLNLEKANSVVTPVEEEVESKEADKQGRWMEDQCDAEHVALYKYVAARLNYLSPDRPDIQYGVKEVCRRMSDPTWRDMA